jgi:predicted nucleic acid-binding protein
VTEPVVAFDAGAIEQIVTNKEFRGLVDQLLRGGWSPVVPTPVLAEAITGRPGDAATNQALGRTGTVATDGAVARLAGALRYDASRDGRRGTPSGIDAIVAAHAVHAGKGVVFTTDVHDLRRLLARTPDIEVERP